MATLFQRALRGLLQDWSGGVIDPPSGWVAPMAGPINGREEAAPGTFQAAVEGAYRRNGIIFACNLARLMVFTEARFAFRQRRGGRPGDLVDGPGLRLLDAPWPGEATAGMLARMIQDVDMVGNAFVVNRGDRLRRLRPDWVTIVTGSELEPELAGDALDGELLGYIYHPRGPSSAGDEHFLMPEEVAHFAPIPDPVFSHRGMSWLTPIARELAADQAATIHKGKFFENGASGGIAITLDSSVSPEMFQKFKAKFDESYAGVSNAYRTMIMGGGAQIHNIGANLQQLSFAATQGAGETRIAAAAGVPPVIAGFSEGLHAATYSNYSQARRRFADGTIRPLWRAAAQALATIIDVPDGHELWYDDRDIAFLREDRKDSSAIQSAQAQTIRTLVDAGYTPETAIRAVTSENFRELQHSGLYSVQLQPPNPRGAEDGTAEGEPPADGGDEEQEDGP
ncbi:phage portal protein [Nocardiopsis trehalosi]|uniref:phage portal protein n=1 Tax=Nocardiopsis trehalosi TaxID=109329 RepID=UPI00082E98AB|nr:phage portal protein [Nocardiopsis trehalosi]